jgi:chitodextrinase
MPALRTSLLLVLLASVAFPACSADEDGKQSVQATAVPGAPSGLHATPGVGNVVLTWTAPVGQPVHSYTATAMPGGLVRGVGNSTLLTFIGLTPGTAYTFTVHASNNLGNGPESAPTAAVVPLEGMTPPGPPDTVTATAGIHSAVVEWTPPTNTGGSPVLAYIVSPYLGHAMGEAVTVTGLTHTFSGLLPATTYTFQVQAVNTLGNSAPTTSAAVTVPADPVAPDPPTDVVAVHGFESAQVHWNAPTNDGGSPILSYTATAYPGGHFITVPSDTTTGAVSGLTVGATYTFKVAATNAVGNSNLSVPSAPITIITLASPPTNVSVTPATGSATVTWGAPTSDGGDPITGYVVTTVSPVEVNALPDFGPDVFSAHITGLMSDVDYSFQVVALNGAGAGNPATTAVVRIP